MSERPFHDRDGFIWFDGQLVPHRDAKVHVLTHAMHYGSSVFEGQRAYNGKIFKLEEHTIRLRASANLLGFDLPYTNEEINNACYELMKANGFTDCYLRPVAWRGSEQMGISAQKTKIHVAIAAWEWPSYYSMEERLKGLKLDIARYRRPAPYTAPSAAKAAGLYMICTVAKHAAEDKGCADAMMMDYRGRVAEATSANIFFVQNGEIHTPDPDCFLNGITRQTVIELAEKAGIPVHVRAIWPEELADFDECFLTGTAAEVSPVAEIGPWKFTPGEVCKRLMADYDNLVWGRA